MKSKNPNINTKFNNRTKKVITYAVSKQVTQGMKTNDKDKDDGK